MKRYSDILKFVRKCDERGQYIQADILLNKVVYSLRSDSRKEGIRKKLEDILMKYPQQEPQIRFLYDVLDKLDSSKMDDLFEIIAKMDAGNFRGLNNYIAKWYEDIDQEEPCCICGESNRECQCPKCEMCDEIIGFFCECDRCEDCDELKHKCKCKKCPRCGRDSDWCECPPCRECGKILTECKCPRCRGNYYYEGCGELPEDCECNLTQPHP